MSPRAVASVIAILVSLSAFIMMADPDCGHGHQCDCQNEDSTHHLESPMDQPTSKESFNYTYYTYYECPYCGKTFYSYDAYQSHVNSEKAGSVWILPGGFLVLLVIIGLIAISWRTVKIQRQQKTILDNQKRLMDSNQVTGPSQNVSTQQEIQNVQNGTKPKINDPELSAILSRRSTQALTDAGYDAHTLVSKGVYASDLRKMGFGAYDLHFVLHFTSGQLLAGGYTQQELDEAGVPVE